MSLFEIVVQTLNPLKIFMGGVLFSTTPTTMCALHDSVYHHDIDEKLRFQYLLIESFFMSSSVSLLFYYQ